MFGHKLAHACGSIAALFLITSAQAQVSMTALNTPLTQNFDSLANAGTTNAWANNSTLPGWYVLRGAAPPEPTNYAAGDGTPSATFGLYSLGPTGSTDRALGAIISNGFAGNPGAVVYAVRLTNNTGADITSLQIGYTGEQWQRANNAAAQSLNVAYVVASAGTTTPPTSGWTDLNSLTFTSVLNGATAGAATDGNANRAILNTTTTLATPMAAGQEVWVRWVDTNDTGSDHVLAIDDFSITPLGGVDGLPALSMKDVSVTEGNSSTTTATFTVDLSAPAPASGVTFDIATADNTATAGSDYVAKSLTAQTIPAGSITYIFTVTINGDTTTEPNETFFVNVTNVVGATVADGQALGTIINDDFGFAAINQIQGAAGASALLGTTVTTRGIVTAVYPGFRGFYIQSQASDEDADPTTSEGVFVFTNNAVLPPEAAVGNLLQVTGVVGEFGTAPNTATQIGSGTATPVLAVLSTGNALPAPIPLSLPLASATALERYEGMRVSFPQTLTVSGNFALGRFGEVLLSSKGRLINPSNAIDLNDDPPSGNSISGTSNLNAVTAAIVANSLNQITLDDATSAQNPDPAPFGLSAANGDTLRAGSTTTGVVGVVNQIAQGYRLLSDPSNLPNFNRAARPLTPPNVGGQTKAAGFNVLNYFNGNGTNQDGAPGGYPTPRGANNLNEYVRQSAKTVAAIQALAADIVGVIEVENDDASGTDCSGAAATTAVCDLVGKLNTSDAASQWTKVPLPPNWGSSAPTPLIGSSDAITTRLIYKNANVEPVGAPLFCNDASFSSSRTPLAQVFRSRITGGKVIVSINHFKSKSCGTATGAEADQGDGQGCWAPTRLAQAQALIGCVNQWQTASRENRVLLLGDFNAYEQENAIDAFRAASLVPLINNSYSFVFDGASGSLDHAIASPQLVPQVTGADKWHINADEPITLDYNTEFKTVGQQSSLYAPDPFRSSDHDPALVGMALIDGNDQACKLDLDGDGRKTINVDGLIALRAMLGMEDLSTGGTLFPSGATRTEWAAIRGYLSTVCPTTNPFCALDVDGSGTTDANVDGLIILRSLLGFTDAAVVGNLNFPGSATRTTWPQLRNYLTGMCGVNLH